MKDKLDVEKKGKSLFGRFYNPKHLDDYITSLCHGDVRTGDLYILVGMFERTVKEGWKSLDIYQRDSDTSLSDSRHYLKEMNMEESE